jgi:hypothetical protein
MQRKYGWLVAAMVVCLLGGVVGAAAAQTMTSSMTQAFEVVSVVGNHSS